MIFHCYSWYDPSDAGAKLRCAVARMTWAVQPWKERPVLERDLPRAWNEEGKTLPYVHDVFCLACQGLAPSDILCYTNADICVRSDCATQIAAAMQKTDALYSYRRDFGSPLSCPIADSQITDGQDYCGSDLFAFRVSWWTRYQPDMPDLLIGVESWDACLRHLVDITNPGNPTSIRNLIYHQRHNSWWEHPSNRYRLKCQQYSLNLAGQWLRQHGVNPAIHGIP